MIYKTLKKVSEYCQLLDKSVYPTTQTVDGVTFTNNGDGTITVNETSSTSDTIFYPLHYVKYTYGHIYLLWWTNNNSSTMKLETNNGEKQINAYEYVIFTAKANKVNRVFIDVYPTSKPNNVIVKPQLFDLTEMYGAGNEPTTVEEFRTKFPNELYDYKPYCFVKSYKTLLKAADDKIITSYKKSLICTTKNLFDNIPVKTNYIIKNNGEEVATPGFNIYGKIYGNNFTISTNAPVDLTNSDNWLRVCLYNSAGTFITRKDFNFNTRTVVNISDDNIAYIQLCFSRTSFTNYKLQVELGSTATEYHPYGYL